MRKVDVVRPPINYAIVAKKGNTQVAWFLDLEDAEEFLRNMVGSDLYEVAEVRR